MQIKILSAEVKTTNQTLNNQAVSTVITQVSCECAVLEVVFLFTRSGDFLPKSGKPIVKFRDFNKQNGRAQVVGQTNYQSLLYNRVIERLGEVKTLITSYLLQNDFIDATLLKEKSPTLYLAASQTKVVFSK
jgi:hypothetical protein